MQSNVSYLWSNLPVRNAACAIWRTRRLRRGRSLVIYTTRSLSVLRLLLVLTSTNNSYYFYMSVLTPKTAPSWPSPINTLSPHHASSRIVQEELANEKEVRHRAESRRRKTWLIVHGKIYSMLWHIYGLAKGQIISDYCATWPQHRTPQSIVNA